MGVGEVAVVLDFVAVAGDAGLLAADEVEAWRKGWSRGGGGRFSVLGRSVDDRTSHSFIDDIRPRRPPGLLLMTLSSSLTNKTKIKLTQS